MPGQFVPSPKNLVLRRGGSTRQERAISESHKENYSQEERSSE
jgi:hypothetical protein